MPKHIIKKLDESAIPLINDNFAQMDLLKLDNFAGGEINTGTVVINKYIVQAPIETKEITAGTVERILEPGDDIQSAIDAIAETGGIVRLRNGLYTLDNDITIPSTVYLHGETAEGVILDFVDNTHGIVIQGDNKVSITADFTQGSETVTTTGGDWLTSIAAGQKVLTSGGWLLIIDVVSDNELTLELPYSGATATLTTVVSSVASDIEVSYMSIVNSTGLSVDCGLNIYLNTILVSNSLQVSMSNSSNSTIQSVNVYGCAESMSLSNVYLTELKTPGIIGGTTEGLVISDCENISANNLFSVYNGTYGLLIQDSTNILVSGTVFGNADGVSIPGSNGVLLNEMSVSENGSGITTSSSVGTMVANSKIASNVGTGLTIDETDVASVISGNLFSGNGTEISDSGTGTELAGNFGITNSYITDISGKQDTLVSGTNIKTINGASILGSGDLTVSGTGGGITWEDASVDTQMTVNYGYIANAFVNRLIFTLPSTAAVGDTVKVAGHGDAGWKITLNTDEMVHFGTKDTTTTTGYIESTHQYDAVELICTVANSEWNVVSSIGNITVA